jgi:peroxiredoxin
MARSVTNLEQQRASSVKPVGRIPAFDLPEVGGGHVSPSRYRGQRSLVLVFVHGDDEICQDILRAFASHYEEYRDQEAEVLAIFPGAEDDATRLKQMLKLPFPVLVDVDGRVGARIGAVTPSGAPALGVFVADCYGEIYVRFVEGLSHNLPDQAEFLDWLWFISIQCPECADSPQMAGAMRS